MSAIPAESLPASAIVFSSLAAAKAAMAAIDTAKGLPAAAIPKGSPCAVTYSRILAHPTLAKWAILVPAADVATIMQILAQASIVPPAAAALDATWSGYALSWPLPADIAAAQARVGTASVGVANAH